MIEKICCYIIYCICRVLYTKELFSYLDTVKLIQSLMN